MKTFPRLVPCLDVRDGRVVKGINFTHLRDAGDPVELAHLYQQQGADEIVLLDITATLESRATVAALVRQLRSVLSIPLTVGGGVRSLSDARVLLESGADKVSINSAAIANPALINQLADHLGSQCVVVAIDTKHNPAGIPKVHTRAGTTATPLDAVAWAIDAAQRGCGEILLTSMDADGTGTGYDLDTLQRITSAVSVPVIASGGARTASHIAAAFHAGATAALAASIFHDGILSLTQLKSELLSLGIRTRPC